MCPHSLLRAFFLLSSVLFAGRLTAFVAVLPVAAASGAGAGVLEAAVEFWRGIEVLVGADLLAGLTVVVGTIPFSDETDATAGASTTVEAAEVGVDADSEVANSAGFV